MPTGKMGLLFIKDGEVTQPDPDRLEAYEPHAGQRRGHWPTNPEIAHIVGPKRRLLRGAAGAGSQAGHALRGGRGTARRWKM
jgi:hypothetical protein